MWAGGEPSDVVHQEDGSLCSAAEPPLITDEHDVDVSERVLSFVVEFADILLQNAKHRYR